MGRPKSTAGRAKAPAESPPPVVGKKTAAEWLDEILPRAEPAAVEVHLHAAMLETGGPAQLLELALDPATRPFLLCRLGPGTALVDPGRAPELVDVLRRRGHTPKVLKS